MQSLTVDIPKGTKELTLDGEEIKRLYEIKLLSSAQYFYFALLCTYGTDNPTVDKDNFCKEWRIKPYDFDLLLAQLQKKGVLSRKEERYVQLRLFSEEEE